MSLALPSWKGDLEPAPRILFRGAAANAEYDVLESGLEEQAD
jgi:hypothetical protein